MAITDGDIVWAGSAADKLYNQNGFSTTIRNSYSTSTTRPHGAHWDGTNMYSTDVNATDAYKWSGFSSTLTTSIATVSEPFDCSFDGSSDFIYCRAFGATDKVMKTSGFSITVSDSFAATDINPHGCGWDGSNVLVGGTGSNKIRQYSGFTSTVNDSFASPQNSPQGVSHNATDTFLSTGSGFKHIQMSGFSSTVTDSYTVSAIDTANNGIGTVGTGGGGTTFTPKIIMF